MEAKAAIAQSGTKMLGNIDDIIFLNLKYGKRTVIN
jgi:hypothetical protein